MSSWPGLVEKHLADWPIDYAPLSELVPSVPEKDIIKRMGLPFKEVKQPSKAETLAELKKSSALPGKYMQLSAIPSLESARALKRKRREQRLKTTGKKWFDLPRQEPDEEKDQTQEILLMRRSMDTKTFYKRNDREKAANYYQIGTIQDNPADFYSSRVPKRQRKKDMVDELLANEEFMKKLRKRYRKIQEAKVEANLKKRNKLKRLAKQQKSKASKNKSK